MINHGIDPVFRMCPELFLSVLDVWLRSGRGWRNELLLPVVAGRGRDTN